MNRPEVTSTWGGDLEDARDELRLRLFALPVALLGMWLLMGSQTSHFLLRTFLSMWIHELGHAVTAWLCGFPAFRDPGRPPSGRRAPRSSSRGSPSCSWASSSGASSCAAGPGCSRAPEVCSSNSWAPCC
ncbi:hypothetical protein ACN28S_41040 [Cystobacter fuscus]